MLIVMDSGSTDEQLGRVIERIETLGFKAHPIPGAARTAIGITGNKGALDGRLFEVLPGVKEAIRVSKPFKLVSRETHPEPSVVDVGGVQVAHRARMLAPGVREDVAVEIVSEIKAPKSLPKDAFAIPEVGK